MNIFMDFMGYARNIAVKKFKKLKIFHELVTSLWSTFKPISNMNTDRYSFFDLYKGNNIKSQEQDDCNQVKGIATEIYQSDQFLSVEMKKFWLV